MDRKANPIIAKPPKYSKRLRFQLDLSIYNLQWVFLVPGNSKLLTNKFLEEPGTFWFNQELLGKNQEEGLILLVYQDRF